MRNVSRQNNKPRPPKQRRLRFRLLVGAVIALVCGLSASWAIAQAPNEPPAQNAGEQTTVGTQSPSVAASPAAASPEIEHRGSGQFVAPPANAEAAPQPAPGEPRLNIRFDRAPVGIVVQSLLADFAHASVVIDPRVEGELTIRSEGQLSAAELPSFLNTSVESLGLELVRQGANSYVLRPLPHEAGGPNAEIFQPGVNTHSGLVIYGLRHVSAAEMARLLQPFSHQGVTVQPEQTREILILSGPPDQVQALTRTIELLDVDWLDGVSFAIAPLEYADPAALIGELHALFGGENGPIGSMVEFVPLPSRNAILILAKRPERLDQAQNWIRQLDRPHDTGGRIRFLPILNADAEHIAQSVSSLFGEHDAPVHITADAATNSLIIQSDPATYDEIANLVHNLDAPIDQVVIEVTIAEVDLNNDLRFGVQWSIDTRNGGLATLTDASNGAVGSTFPGFSYSFAGNYVQAALNALSSRTHVEVISSPVVLTLDNQEAILQVGDQVPIVTQTTANVATSAATVVNTVQYRDTGILLRVTPRIGAGDNVTLEVSQEASEVVATTTSGIDSPTIQQRKFQSTVSIANGSTVALGGLIRANRTRTHSGVPFLSDVPLLGMAFRASNNVVRRTELLVFLTPRIVRSTADAEAATADLSRRLERIRASSFIQSRSPAN